jgi:hypothetical protein
MGHGRPNQLVLSAFAQMLPMTRSLLMASAQLLLQRHPLRTGDAIQLASCLQLQEHFEDDVTFFPSC